MRRILWHRTCYIEGMLDHTEFEPVLIFRFPIVRRVLLTQAELASCLEALPRVTTARVTA